MVSKKRQGAAQGHRRPGAAFLKRFLTRMARQQLCKPAGLYGAWRVWLHKLREERRTRGSRARRARHDAMLATLREHAPGERTRRRRRPVAWASGRSPRRRALPQLCQHPAVTERAAGDLLCPGTSPTARAAAGLIALPPLDADHDARMPRLIWRSAGRLRRRPHELARAARGAAGGAARTTSSLAPRPPFRRWRRRRRRRQPCLTSPAPAPASFTSPSAARGAGQPTRGVVAPPGASGARRRSRKRHPRRRAARGRRRTRRDTLAPRPKKSLPARPRRGPAPGVGVGRVERRRAVRRHGGVIEPAWYLRCGRRHERTRRRAPAPSRDHADAKVLSGSRPVPHWRPESFMQLRQGHAAPSLLAVFAGAAPPATPWRCCAGRAQARGRRRRRYSEESVDQGVRPAPCSATSRSRRV